MQPFAAGYQDVAACNSAARSAGADGVVESKVKTVQKAQRLCILLTAQSCGFCCLDEGAAGTCRELRIMY